MYVVELYKRAVKLYEADAEFVVLGAAPFVYRHICVGSVSGDVDRVFGFAAVEMTHSAAICHIKREREIGITVIAVSVYHIADMVKPVVKVNALVVQWKYYCLHNTRA